jgi:dihydrofolate reductase
MSKVRVQNFSISVDGFGTGEGQTLDDPFGHAGHRLHQWFFPIGMFGPPGPEGIDLALARFGWDAVGAEIMGRNKFGPQRGPWPDDGWEGWWGDEPPFHTPVFVLTHHPRPSIEKEGGTVFHFIDAAPEEALRQAREAAGDRDVRIGGGVDVVRQFLVADLVDEMHLVITPIVLGRGERLWDGLEGIESRFRVESVVSPSGVIHQMWTRAQV